MKGILGRKVGMTQVFTTDGELVPVTVIACNDNVVLQKKTVEVDGYTAIQIGFEDKKEKHSSKAAVGHAKKAETAPKRFVREIRSVDINNYELGQVISTDLFEVGEFVDVTGISKGKGFQGAIKRHNQSIGPMAHGSRYHRRPGSMGAVAPNRVFKGKKLAGHMGAQRKTIQNLVVVAVDVENNYLLIKGNVPGSKKALLMVRSAIKKTLNPTTAPKELVSYE